MIFAVNNFINLNVLLNIVRFFVPIYLSGLAFAYKKCEIQFAIYFVCNWIRVSHAMHNLFMVLNQWILFVRKQSAKGFSTPVLERKFPSSSYFFFFFTSAKTNKQFIRFDVVCYYGPLLPSAGPFNPFRAKCIKSWPEEPVKTVDGQKAQ